MKRHNYANVLRNGHLIMLLDDKFVYVDICNASAVSTPLGGFSTTTNAL